LAKCSAFSENATKQHVNKTGKLTLLMKSCAKEARLQPNHCGSLTGCNMTNNKLTLAFINRPAKWATALAAATCAIIALGAHAQPKPWRAAPQGTIVHSGTILNPASNLCLDLRDSNANDGNNVQLGACTNMTASWDVVDLGGEYALINRATRQVADVGGGNTNDGANIQQYTWNNSGAQRWRIESLTNGAFQIINQNSGKCVDIASNATNIGANVQQWRCHGQGNQQWRIGNLNVRGVNRAPSVGGESARPNATPGFGAIPNPNAKPLTIENGRVTGRRIYSGMIVSRASSMCVDVQRASTADGANIQQWGCNSSAAQLWDFYDLGNNEVAVILRSSSKAMDVDGARNENGANIAQSTWHGGGNQRWRMEQAGRGFVKLVSVATGKCADVDGGRAGSEGANISQWECHGRENQQWRIEVSGTGAGWNNYASPIGTNTWGSQYADNAAANLVGTWEGNNPVYQSRIRLSIFSDGNAQAIVDGNLRVNGYIRNNQLFLGAERYDIEMTRNGFRTLLVGQRSNVVNYTRVR
jgi:Ricin-type beta-trefoil lectin domain